jgi:hypothetical protein
MQEDEMGGYVARMGEMRINIELQSKVLKGRDHLAGWK